MDTGILVKTLAANNKLLIQIHSENKKLKHEIYLANNYTLWSIKEVAEFLSVSYHTLRKNWEEYPFFFILTRKTHTGEQIKIGIRAKSSEVINWVSEQKNRLQNLGI